MFRSLLLFGVMSSLMAVGQTAGGQTGAAGGTATAQPVLVAPGTYGNGLVVNSGYVTTGVPVQGPVNPPLLSPPNISLPGSGPATGAPPSVDVNNPTSGGTGDVVFPGAGVVSPALNGAAPEQPGPAANRGDVARSGILNLGLGKVVSNPQAAVAAAAQAPSTSLGDIARMYKARRAVDRPKEFDNAKLEGRYENTPQSNAVPQSSNEATANQPNNQSTAALDQRDLATVEAELARSRAAEGNRDTAVVTPNNPNYPAEVNTTIAQATPPQNPSTSATTPQAPQENAPAADNAQKKQLPATATPLPMLGLMGVLAAGVGAVYAFRSRT